jgi:hypothetical protein
VTDPQRRPHTPFVSHFTRRRHTLRLHDGHDCIGGVGEEFTVTLEFVEASWGRDCISVRAH